MSVFNEDQIRRAIDNFQKSHPPFAFFDNIDVSHIKDEESLNIIKDKVDVLCKKAEKDHEMYVIMEMAKAYLNGAKPVYNAEREEYWWEIVEPNRSLIEINRVNSIVRCPKCKTIRLGMTYYCSWCGSKMMWNGMPRPSQNKDKETDDD